MVSHIVRRVREERLPQVAGGLTLATAVSLVPLLAVSFALFEHVANLRPAGAAVRDHLLRGLLPPEAARLILEHLTRFVSNSSGLPAIGFAFLLLSALGLLWSVEGTLNRIWQVTKPRPVLRRIALCAVWLLL